MKRITAAVAFLLLASAPAMADASAACRVEAFGPQGRPLAEGSGTVIAKCGEKALVLTSAHTFCDENMRPVRIGKVECYFAKVNRVHGASLVDLDPAADLAAILIRCDAKTGCVPVAADEPSREVSAQYFGHPMGEYRLLAITAAYDRGWMNAPSRSGYSGSGVIAGGRLVAVVQGTTNTDTVCVPTGKIRRYLQMRIAPRLAWVAYG